MCLQHVLNFLSFVWGVFSPTVQTIIIQTLCSLDSGLPASNNNNNNNKNNNKPDVKIL